jgi:CBS-domain-containing membrane protein
VFKTLRGLSPRANYTDLVTATKLLPTFADRGCCVVSVMDSHGRIFGFLDQSLYYFFQVAPQFYT